MSYKPLSVDRIIKNVSATLAFEGLKPSVLALELNKMLLEGKTSSNEARTAILNQYNLKGKSRV